MNFLNTYSGTNWETPAPRRSSRSPLLLVVVAVLLAAVVQASAARAWVTVHGESYGARLRISVRDNEGVHPFYVSLSDVSGQFGQYANGKTYSGDIPSGRYAAVVEILRASGDFEQLITRDVEVSSSGELFATDWFGISAHLAYGAGLDDVTLDPPVAAPVGGSGGSGSATIEWDYANAAYAFSVGFFMFLSFGVWRSTRRIFNDAD